MSPARAGVKALALIDLCTLRPLPETIIDELDPTLTALLQAAESRVRMKAALRLSKCDWAPRETVRALAFDALEIAAPLLSHSSVISDQDLLVLASKGMSHRTRLARRSKVAASLSAEIAQYKEAECLIALARNPGVELDYRCAQGFAEMAQQDAALRQALAGRSGFDPDFARAIYELSGETVRNLIMKVCPECASARVNATIQHATEINKNDADLGQLAEELTETLHSEDALTAADVLRATENGRSDISDHAVARLTGLGAADWRRALRKSPVRASFLAARSMGMALDDALAFFTALCEMGRAHRLQSAHAHQAAAQLYEQYSELNARQALHRMGANGSIG